MIVYKTTNLINGKIYIGKACGKSVVNGYLGSGIELVPDIIKYGKQSFRRVTIDFATNEKEQCQKEIFWIKFYREKLGIYSLYNISDGGEGASFLKSEETKKKISMSHKGKKQSEQHRKNNSIARKKQFENKENRPYFGKPKSEETKLKISLAKKGKQSPRKGKTHSVETRIKQSIVKIGKNNPMSKENRLKRQAQQIQL